MWSRAFLIFAQLFPTSAIMCFMCGPASDGSPQGGCRSQFQYDCSPATLRMPEYTGRILCRSTRIMDDSGAYSFSKECITEDDHFLAYPDYVGKPCFQPNPNSTLCVCGTDLCNGLTISQQMSQAFAPVRSDSPPPGLGSQPVAEFNVNANLDYLTAKGEYLQVQPQQLRTLGLPDEIKHKQLVQIPPVDLQNSGHNQLAPQNAQTTNNQFEQSTTSQQQQLAERQQATAWQHPTTAHNVASWNAPTASQTSQTSNFPASQRSTTHGQYSTTRGQHATTRFQHSTTRGQLDSTIAPQEYDPNLMLPIDTNPSQTMIAVDHETLPDHVTMHKEQAMPTKAAIEFNQDGTSVNFRGTDVSTTDLLDNVAGLPKVSNRFQNLTSLGAFVPQTSQEPLSCILCTEASANEDGQCSNFETSQCNIPNMKGPSYLRCLTRRTKLADGNSALEKFCVDVLDLASEYGPSINTTAPTGCYSAAEGLVKFCLCAEPQCNGATLKAQIEAQDDFVKEIKMDVPGEYENLQGANMCKRCIRSNMNTPSECESLLDFDCSQQYRNDTEVYCLTRLIKNASGLYSIERRCVSKADHEKGYPGTQVVHEGCGEAWNGHVQYCVCKGNNCNQHSLIDQQAKMGFVPTMIETTEEPHPQVGPEPEPETRPEAGPEMRPGTEPEPSNPEPEPAVTPAPKVKKPERPMVKDEPAKPTEVPQWRRFGNAGLKLGPNAVFWAVGLSLALF